MSVNLKRTMMKLNESLIQQIIDTYKRQNNSSGYDIEANEWIKMREQGLIDSYQVVKTALEVATSMAAVFLTTDVVITDAVGFPH